MPALRGRITEPPTRTDDGWILSIREHHHPSTVPAFHVHIDKHPELTMGDDVTVIVETVNGFNLGTVKH